jgi:hypothetical protein
MSLRVRTETWSTATVEWVSGSVAIFAAVLVGNDVRW